MDSPLQTPSDTHALPAARMIPHPAAPLPAAGCGCATAPERPLDLSGMSAPGDLGSVQVEEFTIDSICGVY